MEKILISRCFLGEKVRYDGNHNQLTHPLLQQWLMDGRLIAICPECAGGLPTPRDPAEIQASGRILSCKGQDVTAAFEHGASCALQLCKLYDIRYALLKERSPSCGSTQIYDGSFSGIRIQGQGITAQALHNVGVTLFNEHQIEALAQALASSESLTG